MTDHDDALKLAKRALLDALTPAHIPTPEVRQQRVLVKHRKKSTVESMASENAIRSLRVNQGIEIDTCKPGLKTKPIPFSSFEVRRMAPRSPGGAS